MPERRSETGGITTATAALPRQAARSARAFAFVREMLLLIVAALIYALVRRVTQGSPDESIANGQAIWDLERAVHINVEPSLQAFTLQHIWLRDLANWVYIFGHWPVIIGCAVALAWRAPARYRELRSAILLSGVVSFALFAFYPAAPPRLADTGLIDTVTRWSGSYRLFQPPQYTNIYAAMPSLHFGWDLLVAISLWQTTRHRAVRAFAIVVPCTMALAVIATANHYLLDVLVALIIVLTSRFAVVHYARAHQ